MPGVTSEVMSAGGLAVFVPRVEPPPIDEPSATEVLASPPVDRLLEPDFGENHLPTLELLKPAQTADIPHAVDDTSPAPAKLVHPGRKPVPRPLPAAAAPHPEPAPPPPPPVHERWQTLLARMPRTDWHATVFEGH